MSYFLESLSKIPSEKDRNLIKDIIGEVRNTINKSNNVDYWIKIQDARVSSHLAIQYYEIVISLHGLKEKHDKRISSEKVLYKKSIKGKDLKFYSALRKEFSNSDLKKYYYRIDGFK